MKDSKHKAAIQNPALTSFSALAGDWKTVGSHPYLPGMVLHGHTSFNWIEGGAFLVMHSDNDEGKIPSGIAIFASDNATENFLCFTLMSGKFQESMRFRFKTMF